MATNRYIYKPRIKTAADRGLFFGIVGIGVAVAILSKWIAASPIFHIFVPLGFDLGLQVLYAFLVMAVPLFRLRDDRAGDSFYYVGLLFTLASLAQTLWEFGASQESDSSSTQVISGFGLALATTIMGLALRVFVQNFRSDPVEIENEAHNTLVDASSKLTTELYSIVSEMSTFRQSMKQMTEEGMRDTVQSATSAMTETATKFSAEVESLVGTLTTTFDRFEASAENFADVSKSTVAALSRFSTRIDKMEPPSNVVEFVFGPARDHMIEMAKTLTQATEGQKEQIQRLGELASVAVRALGALDASITSINAGARKSAEAVETAQAISAKNAEISSELIQLTASLNEGAKRQQAALSEMESILSAASQKLTGTVEGMARGQIDAISSVEKAVASLAGTSARHAKAIDDQLEHARAASAKLVNEIVELADIVAEKLA